ncbi:hypothetical protein BDC45DRAFT_498263, partial [Circinella umbellata]
KTTYNSQDFTLTLGSFRDIQTKYFEFLIDNIYFYVYFKQLLWISVPQKKVVMKLKVVKADR